jgi:hypothetical protein
MPLQNRVDPYGELIATPARGLFMGNRGGRLHRDDRTLGRRRYVTRAWICCVLEFNNRQRDVWGRYYTELFFLDEPTALAAGHRPCSECRRKDAQMFADLWAKAFGLRARPRASEMDDILHAERLDGRGKRLHRRAIEGLPDGAFVVIAGAPFALRGNSMLHWTPAGYGSRKPRPHRGSVDVLTPPALLNVLAAGYRPRWHPSAEDRIVESESAGAPSPRWGEGEQSAPY